MAITPTRTSNFRTAGWLMLTSVLVGLLAGLLLILWEKPQYEGTFADFFTYNINGYLVYGLLLAANLPALFTAVGISVSRGPARIFRAALYFVLGGVIDFCLLMLTQAGEISDFDFGILVIFHLLVTLTLIPLLVRKSSLVTRSLIKRSALALAIWGIILGAIATLTFPFTQYGSATAATEDSEVHELRQVSERLLTAVSPELVSAKGLHVKGSSSNAVSVFGTGELGCKFNTANAFFDVQFSHAVKFKTAPPELVQKKSFAEMDPNTQYSESDRKSLEADSNFIYTDASRKASKAYWDGAKKRIQARLGELPDGWKAKYVAGDDHIAVWLDNKRENAQVFTTLTDGIPGLFSGISQSCYPLDKAPNDEH